MSVARSAFASRPACRACAAAAGAAEHVAGDPAGQTLDAVRLGAVAAEPLVEQHRVEARQARLERRPPVGVPEEARVAQARHEHALEVARDELARRPARCSSRRGTPASAGRSSFTTGKKCWWWIIVVVSTSSGSWRNSAANVPATTDGYSTRSGTSCRRRDWLAAAPLTRPPRRRACASSSRAIFGVALLALEQHEVLARACARYSSNDRTLMARPARPLRRQEPVAVGDRARAHVLDDARSARPPCGRSRTARRARRTGTESSGSDGRTAARRVPSSSIASQCICFGNDRSRSTRAEHVGQHVDGGLAAHAACGRRGTRPWASRSRSSAAASTPCLRAKPAAAGVGSPSGLNAAETGGPISSSSRSVWRSAMLGDARRQAARRAVGLDRRLGTRGGASFSRAADGLAESARSAAAASSPESPRSRVRCSSSRSICLLRLAGRLGAGRGLGLGVAPWRWPRRAAARAGCTRCAR